MTSVPGANMAGKTAGLLGVFDGDVTNDFMLPNGTVLASDVSADTIYYSFGESCKCLTGCKRIPQLYIY